MDLKNAITVCLISLFSATLVVLIARTLDSQAAAKLEPHLERIANELEVIRKGGGISATAGDAEEDTSLQDGLVVYYLHSNTRCPTCESIESQAHDVVTGSFEEQLDSGELSWKILNYEKPEGKDLAVKFDVMMPVVVLARMKSGEVEAWNRLDQVWGVVNDPPAFAKYVKGEIDKMLQPTGDDTSTETPVVPEPTTGNEMPLPTGPADLPLPTGPAVMPLPIESSDLPLPTGPATP